VTAAGCFCFAAWPRDLKAVREVHELDVEESLVGSVGLALDMLNNIVEKRCL